MRVVNCGGVGRVVRQRWGWHGKDVSISDLQALYQGLACIVLGGINMDHQLRVWVVECVLTF